MHISEGVLSPGVLIAGGVIAAAGITYGLKKLEYDKVPKAGLLGSAFFVASLIHIPFGPTSVHLILNGLVGLFLGWMSFPVIFTALLLQAILFQFGGITTLGVNTVNMALPAVICYYLYRPMLKRNSNFIWFTAGSLSGITGVLLGCLLLGVSLTFSGEKFIEVAEFAVLAHIPVMIIEAIIIGFILLFFRKVRPEMVITICLLCIFSTQLSAHNVSLFAYRENGKINIEGYFNDGTPTKNSTVDVYDKTGKKIYQGITDKEGLLSFKIDNKDELKIVLNASLGHRAEFVLPGLNKKTKVAAPDKKITIEKTKPFIWILKRALCGIGYILGLMGILLYFQNRKLKKELSNYENK